MMYVRKRLIIVGVLVATAPLAAAAPWSIAYEGNDYPENEGWVRLFESTPPTRQLDDSILTLDTRPTDFDLDYYIQEPSFKTSPDAGETLVIEARLRVTDIVGLSDTFFTFIDEQSYAVSIRFYGDGVDSLLEEWPAVPVDTSQWHTYRLESEDMRSYRLLIDGVLVQHGVFERIISSNRFGWGHDTDPSDARSEWDYVRFGVIPEPSTVLGVVGLCFMLRRIAR